MRKHFTKIICVATAVISTLSIGLTSGCGTYNSKGVSVKDTSYNNVSSNGGFLVETGDYVYFVNGKANYTDDNTYGSVVKGTIERISKSDLAAHNYTTTDTIVPLVVYSGNYDAGIYIYGDYIYYSTPSTDKNSDGVIQSQYLEFKRSKLDGTETMKDCYYKCSSNSVAFRYVEVDGVVYLLYALSESLYGTSTTNIHSVNTQTGVDTLLAYNVSDYLFDEEDSTSADVYYTMDVTTFLGSENSVSEGYNQIYKVSADATADNAPRTYDFSSIEGFDADEDPLYVNLGDFVLDGIGIIENGSSSDRVTQFNYNYKSDKSYVIDHHDYTYELESFKSGKLTFTRAETIGDSPVSSVYSITTDKLTSDWDAIDGNDLTKSNSIDLVLTVSDSTDYTYVTINGQEKVIYVATAGIMIGEISGGKLQNEYVITDASSAEIVALKEEYTSATEKHLYAYYSGSKDSVTGYYRIAIDGNKTDYERNKLQYEDNWAYKDAPILDISVASSWYAPEFVDNQIIFCSSTEGMSSYNYIMACDLTGDDGYIMSNEQLNAYKEKYDAVLDAIDEYDDIENSDGTSAYENLSSALQYLFYTGDSEYLAELIQAYVEIDGEDEEYLYSKQSAQIYLDFANAENDWADYATDVKKVNGTEVHANEQSYYYSVIGQVTEDDQTSISDALKASYMKSYPVDERTWFEKLSTAVKVIFIVGVSLAGLVVLAGLTILTIFLVKKFLKKKTVNDEVKQLDIDISDDKSIDVYDDDSHTTTL